MQDVQSGSFQNLFYQHKKLRLQLPVFLPMPGFPMLVYLLYLRVLIYMHPAYTCRPGEEHVLLVKDAANLYAEKKFL